MFQTKRNAELTARLHQMEASANKRNSAQTSNTIIYLIFYYIINDFSLFIFVYFRTRLKINLS